MKSARKHKRDIDLICDLVIVLGGTAVLHASRCGGRSIFRLFFHPLPPPLFRAMSQEQN
jgi:hypothetical protein